MRSGSRVGPPPTEQTAGVACERCRKRKIKCDRHIPCSKCTRAKVDCSFPGGGERSRPASRKHVQALETQIKSLESYIEKLASSDEATRSRILAERASVAPHKPASPTEDSIGGRAPSSTSTPESGSLVLARMREGRMYRFSARRAAQFYGGTSLSQLHSSGQAVPVTGHYAVTSRSTQGHAAPSVPAAIDPLPFPFHAKDAICRQLMAAFFQNIYHHNMHIYREYFLRDYAASGGPYYSDALMFSICAASALISEDHEIRKLSPVFARHAGTIVFNSLEMPDLTTLQSLITLGHLEVGQGRSSKGWLYCGMAFRLAHEMGLHLDPTNWCSSKAESSLDREILRRVYWAVFVADKQLSLYFGRPPALYPQEADVRNTIRIPYPPEWESLLDEYISKGTSATAFEDGIRMIRCFVHHVELAKIFHTLIVDVFENRTRRSDAAAAAAAAHRVHTDLERWHSLLPKSLHWNQWTLEQVPHYVLNLHMLFYTCMIILHRPPRHHLDDEAVARSEGVEVCYQSLAAILRLLKSYQRYYRLEIMPLALVQTLSAAAEVIMLKRYLEKSSWKDKDISKPTAQILEAMEVIQDVYPCIRDIRQSIIANQEAEDSTPLANVQEPGPIELDLMDFLHAGAGPFPSWLQDDSPGSDNSDLGFLVTDDLVGEPQSFDPIVNPASSRSWGWHPSYAADVDR
ncbi:hypothetical protein NLU13_8760 [Sarocladium strictum]|uniref:Zn(2)-C6 fungal-type domain-containing protein n=1 Tax=Sarocladium strictum TaxID=5046 RepID=A0AA39GCZ9_SARSR|nr:hypothetical protein NLU13_8760 [Sarocladium strictum]